MQFSEIFNIDLQASASGDMNSVDEILKVSYMFTLAIVYLLNYLKTTS